jgi:hypothetical protein
VQFYALTPITTPLFYMTITFYFFLTLLGCAQGRSAERSTLIRELRKQEVAAKSCRLKNGGTLSLPQRQFLDFPSIHTTTHSTTNLAIETWYVFIRNAYVCFCGVSFISGHYHTHQDPVYTKRTGWKTLRSSKYCKFRKVYFSLKLVCKPVWLTQRNGRLWNSDSIVRVQWP